MQLATFYILLLLILTLLVFVLISDPLVKQDVWHLTVQVFLVLSAPRAEVCDAMFYLFSLGKYFGMFKHL